MNPENDKFGFGKMLARLAEAKVDMPKKLAAAGQLYFQQNFDKQQWSGQPWEPRKKETRRSEGKALLVATGRLRQAMQKTIREFNWKQIVWGVDVPYAKYLNFGTENMPAREFMGFDPELKATLQDKVKQSFDKVMLNR